MPDIKYTKTELRQQQIKLVQLKKYLPTLQLKKAMLQLEINKVIQEWNAQKTAMETNEDLARGYQKLLTDKSAEKLFDACEVESVKKRFENIAGVELPIFQGIFFKETDYFLFDTPIWLESGIRGVQKVITTKEKIYILEEQKKLLEKELREVSIRVNLFEKILIPRTESNIKKIKIFLGDQQLAAVSQAKASKRKILERKERKHT